MLEEFLEELRFFSPSPELTVSLFAAVAAVQLGDQIRAREDRAQAEDVDDDYLKNLPPDGTAGESSAGPHASGAEPDELVFQQRFVAEELYHHLAFLAGSPAARSGQPLPIKEAVAEGMANVLGLSKGDPLLSRLEDEFTSWLTGLGQFTTGWGNITLADGHRLYLEVLRPDEKEAVAPARKVFLPAPSASRERARRKRSGAKGAE